jgi:hypothetical protein
MRAGDQAWLKKTKTAARETPKPESQGAVETAASFEAAAALSANVASSGLA